MSKRPFVWTAVCFVLGTLWGVSRRWYLPVCLLFLLGIWQADGWRIQRKKKREAQRRGGQWKGKSPKVFLIFWSMAWILAFVSGSIHAGRQQEYREAYLPNLKEEAEASVQGVVCKKEAKNDEYHIYLKDVILQISNHRYRTNQVLVHLSTDEYSIGTTLVLNGTIQRFRHAVNEGGYEEEQFYHGKKVDYAFVTKEVIGCYGRKAAVREALYQLRKRLKDSLKSNAHTKDVGILAVMLLGEKSLMDSEVKKQYRQAGISHILVISGLHISMLGMGIFGLLRKGKRSIYFSAAMSVLVLAGYVCMTGNSASAIRALLMFALGMGGKCLGRTYDRATGLAFAVLILLWQNPFLIGDSGFLFSVAAVIGVIASGEDARTWQVNAKIQLMTLPLVACYYYEIPIYALLLNLFVLPLVAPIVVSGIFGSVMGLFWAKGARLLLFLPHMLLYVIETAGKLPGQLPYAYLVVGQPEIWQVCGYYVLLVLFLVLENGYWKKRREDAAFFQNRVKRCAAAAGKVTALWFFLTFRQPQDTRIDVLDVGQGDGICIQTKGGVNLFLDGGSSDVFQVGAYRIEPYLKCNGIGEIDYWFLSHADTDHMSGLLELLEEGYTVKHLVLSAYGVGNENLERLLGLAEKNEIPVIYLKEGDVLNLLEGKMKCLFPNAQAQSDDINGNSMILLYEEGKFQALFTGDTGIAQEKEMLKEKLTGEVDFYKAAHHGSNYSNSPEWLSYLKPKISVVSCGEKNRYGHPGREAVEHMSEAGSDIYYTMTGGEISLVIRENEMEIRNYRNPLEAHRYPVVE